MKETERSRDALTRIKSFGYRRAGSAVLAMTLSTTSAACSSGGEGEARTTTAAQSTTSETLAQKSQSSGEFVQLAPHTESAETFSGLDCDTSNIPELADGMVLVDGRCDPNPETPVGLYKEPTQDSMTLGRAPTGVVLEAECNVLGSEGEVLRNAEAQEYSIGSRPIWTRVKIDHPLVERFDKESETAEIPAIWVHGEEDLKSC